MEAILHQHYVSPVITAMRPPFPACLLARAALGSLALGAEGSHACSPNGFSPGTDCFHARGGTEGWLFWGGGLDGGGCSGAVGDD